MVTSERSPTTPTVTLRPAVPADAQRLRTWRGEPSVREHQPLHELSLADLRDDVAGRAGDDIYRAQGEKFQWIVQADGEPVGWITLMVINWEHGLAEVGYALGHAHQRRGIMPRALELLLDDLFTNTALHRLEARCAVDNLASQRVLDRLGFLREGRLRSYFLLHGRRVDNYLYALLASEYFA